MRNIAVAMIGLALMIITALLTYSSVTATYEAQEAKQAAHAAYLEAQNATLQAEQVELIDGIKMKPLGEFEVTHYSYNSGTTKSGVKPSDITIAVDPDVIPLGSLVYMGAEYGWKIALDTGKAVRGNIIDVYLPDKDECIKRGRLKNIKVWIIESEAR